MTLRIAKPDGTPASAEAQAQWDALTDMTVDENGRLDAPFLHFNVGTHRHDVWAWFERTYDVHVY